MDYNKVKLLRNALAQQREINDVISVMSASMPCNKELAERMSAICYHYAEENLVNVSEIRLRRMVLYAILMFVCPIALAGGRLPKGLRQIVSSVLYKGINPCVVSSDMGHVAFWFDTYKDFREHATAMIERIEESLLKP